MRNDQSSFAARVIRLYLDDPWLAEFDSDFTNSELWGII